MIVHKTLKAYSINYSKLNVNFGNEDYILIDETTKEGKALKEKIVKNYPYYDLIIENEKVIDVQVYPNISYSIDNTTITTTEIATITVSDPLPIQVIVDGVDYGVDTDGVIEYQDENVGEHTIELRAEGYKPTIIKIEVIE